MKTLHAIFLLFGVGLLVDLTDCFFPGGRYGATVWNVPDSSDLYIYGGYGIGAQPGLEGRLNDMWRYDYSANSWEWLGGAQVDQAPSFGSQGTASDANTPGGLKYACPFFTADALWLFGGSTQDDQFMNALWSYSMTDNQWTWITGSESSNTPGVYADLGGISTTAYPGGREGAMCYSTPGGKFFGMFGGNGMAESDSPQGYLNDVWIYSVVDNQWGWASGDKIVDVVNIPGPQGVPSSTIYPSGTYNAGSWIYKLNANETYLYFGFGNVRTKNQFNDELWRFQAETFEWTYMRGNEGSTNDISKRTGAAVWGSFDLGDSWIFGGYGYDDQGAIDYLGDLHFYAADTNDYSTMSKTPQQNGIYGEIGVADPNNYPGSRAYAATWQDSDGNLWMFGGFGYDSTNSDAGNLNDVWKFDVNTRQWTWMSGSQFINTPGEYSPQVPTSDQPLSAPVAEPLSDLTPTVQTAPKSQSVGGAPQAAAGELTADQQIGIGVGIGVGGPVVAGAIILAVLLQKRKADKKGNSKSATEANNSTVDPESGNYNVIPGVNPTLSTNTNYGQINAVALDSMAYTTEAKFGGSDNRLIPYSSVTLEKEIGVGSYGKVYLGKLRTTKVAVKVANTKISQEEFIREANFQLAIPPHPNIVQLLGISIDGPEPLVVLEYCNEGSLDKLLFETEKNWTAAEQINLAAAIARGLDHLHQNNIVHRDLAVRNILLHHGEPKISDFGMSRKLKETAQVGKTATNIGPIRWMAPEALGKQTYSTKSDIWTFGILLYEITARQEPHADEDLINVAVKIRDSAYSPSIPEDCPELLREVMEMCWKADPAERPDMSFICEKLDVK